MSRRRTPRSLASCASLVNGASAGDVIVFQYAGHGYQLADPDGDESDGKDEALVPIDFDSGAFVVDDEIREILLTMREGVSLTCFLDCCHSGTRHALPDDERVGRRRRKGARADHRSADAARAVAKASGVRRRARVARDRDARDRRRLVDDSLGELRGVPRSRERVRARRPWRFYQDRDGHHQRGHRGNPGAVSSSIAC